MAPKCWGWPPPTHAAAASSLPSPLSLPPTLTAVLVEEISVGLIDCRNDLHFTAQVCSLGQKMS